MVVLSIYRSIDRQNTNIYFIENGVSFFIQRLISQCEEFNLLCHQLLLIRQPQAQKLALILRLFCYLFSCHDILRIYFSALSLQGVPIKITGQFECPCQTGNLFPQTPQGRSEQLANCQSGQEAGGRWQNWRRIETGVNVDNRIKYRR